jgi:hypothetical protein
MKDERVKIASVAEHGVDAIDRAWSSWSGGDLLPARSRTSAARSVTVARRRAVAPGVRRHGDLGDDLGARRGHRRLADGADVPDGKKAAILQAWTDVQVAGTLRIRSPLFHDNTNGIRKDTIVSELNPFMPFGFSQPISRGDTLIVELAGSAVGGDIEYALLLMWFEQVGSASANFIAPDIVKQKVINYSYVENTIATGATAAWAGAEAINAETDQFHAHRKYCLMGYCVDTEVPAIAWKGIDTGNVRVGGPGLDQDQLISNNWFERLSVAYGRPLIPMIDADNKAATMIDTLQDENGADTTVISIYAELPA